MQSVGVSITVFEQWFLSKHYDKFKVSIKYLLNVFLNQIFILKAKKSRLAQSSFHKKSHHILSYLIFNSAKNVFLEDLTFLDPVQFSQVLFIAALK